MFKFTLSAAVHPVTKFPTDEGGLVYGLTPENIDTLRKDFPTVDIDVILIEPAVLDPKETSRFYQCNTGPLSSYSFNV